MFVFRVTRGCRTKKQAFPLPREVEQGIWETSSHQVERRALGNDVEFIPNEEAATTIEPSIGEAFVDLEHDNNTGDREENASAPSKPN